MNTLGIFGDSFADPSHGHNNYPNDHVYSWVHLLTDTYQVEWYSRGGSSLFYSYEKFLEHHHKYSKIVFVVTEPGRLSENLIKSTIGPTEMITIPNWQVAEYCLNNKSRLIDPTEISRLKAMRDYYIHVDQHKSSLLFSELLVNKIREIRPDVLLINAFYTHTEEYNGVIPSIKGPAFVKYIDTTIRSLMNLPDDEIAAHRKVMTFEEKRCVCHLSIEVNALVAQDIRAALDTGVWDPKIPNRIPHSYPLDFYYDIAKEWWKL